MAKDIVLFGKKKDNYPSKTSLNLYFKDEKRAGISTFTLYLILLVVMLIALSKTFVFDLLTDLSNAQAQYNQCEAILNSYNVQLEKYEEINDEYNRFSYSYLSDQEKIQDRMEVLALLEQTVFAKANAQSIAISGNLISVSLSNIGLDETAALVQLLEESEIVESVTVNTATYGGTYTTKMVITLVGGEQ